jgi:hypothetical protein
MNDEV